MAFSFWLSLVVMFLFILYIYIFFNLSILIRANYFTILYWFCHTSTWIRHGCTRVPNPESPSHLPPHTIPSGLSQCTGSKHPVSCIKPGLAICFLYDIIHVSMPFSQIIPPSLSHRVQKTVLRAYFFYWWAIKSMMQMYHHLFIHSPVTGIWFASSFQLLWIKLLLWTFVCRFYVNASFNLLGINA